MNPTAFVLLLTLLASGEMEGSCGRNALYVAAGVLGCQTTPEAIAEAVPVGENGETSLAVLANAARKIGLSAVGVEMTPEGLLRSNVSAIALFKGGEKYRHFAFLYPRGDGEITVADPAVATEPISLHDYLHLPPTQDREVGELEIDETVLLLSKEPVFVFGKAARFGVFLSCVLSGGALGWLRGRRKNSSKKKPFFSSGGASAVGGVFVVVISGCSPQVEEGKLRVVGESTVDLGRLDDDETGVAQFVLRNDSEQRVEIRRVGLNCGCASANMSSNILAPGASETLTISIEPPEGRPTIGKAKIFLKDVPFPAATVIVRAENSRTPKPTIYPSYLRLPKARIGETVTGTLEVRYFTSGTLHAEKVVEIEVKEKPEWLSVETTPFGNELEQYDLVTRIATVTIRTTPARTGTMRGAVDLNLHTDLGNSIPCKAIVEVTADNGFRISPSQVVFRKSAPPEECRLEVESPFSIERGTLDYRVIGEVPVRVRLELRAENPLLHTVFVEPASSAASTIRKGSLELFVGEETVRTIPIIDARGLALEKDRPTEFEIPERGP